VLEARDLCKEYKTKNGPVVKALDNVNIKFEETGMVFILGKSGSGKSTLLNVLGGLDKYDSGEVIVKGKSSKDFKQADFDSYRNTFIGFIFQDYNILEEFTISKNIGLALELQGKKADKKAIEELMEQVDLKGFGRRKPNTLSGGQKQRVAIARALVKNPEIIMADEPTGALDSNTGKQVLDTLKKLSKTKLVLIVSHDREFAEYYGDRIIELADGKIISDVVKYKSAPKESNGLEIVDDKILTIKKGTKLDASKTKTLQEFISNSEEDIIVSVDEKANKEFKKFAMIDDDGNKESFKKTENLNIKEYDGSKFKLIRSKLPGKDSLKMGASGLKSKPIRLFFTIILSAIAFALFGLADTMGSYDKVENTIVSIRDSKINYASFTKGIKEDPDDNYPREAKLSEADFTKLNNDLDGFNFVPVFNLNENSSQYSFESYIYDTEGISYESLYRHNIYGFVEITADNKNSFGTLLGDSRLPNNDNEIVITKYSYDVFNKGNYKNNSSEEVQIDEVNDLLGKTIRLYNADFTIVGVIDTNCDLSRYSKMEEEDFGQTTSDYMMRNEFGEFLETSYHALGYLYEGYFNRNINTGGLFSYIGNSTYINGMISDSKPSSGSGYSYNYIANFSNEVSSDVAWFEGEKTSLESNEVIISDGALEYMELDINGKKIYYYQLFTNDCRSSAFSSGFNSLLASIGLEQFQDNYDNLLYYYNAFDTSEYKYNGNMTKWSGYWNEYEYGVLTNDQKIAIDQYLSIFTVNYCSNVYDYFETDNISNSLEQQYNIRVNNGEDWSDFDYYINQIVYYYRYNYWDSNYAELTNEEISIISGAKKYQIEFIKQYIPNKIWLSYTSPDGTDYYQNPREMTIVGIYTGKVSNQTYGNNAIISTALTNEFADSLGGVYNFAIAPLDYNNEESVKKIVDYTYASSDKVVYNLNNPVMSSIKQVNNFIENLSEVFLYVGIGFAVFASLLLLNFITISISYKKREIGVLRAIGARGMDVFKIFFNEAFIIAFINFVLASIGSIVICSLINGVIRTDYGMLITILNIGIRQIILMFVVSLAVAFLSSFLPVRGIARKKPIDAIRNS